MNSLFHTSSSLFLFIPSDFPPSCPSYFLSLSLNYFTLSFV
uniref:Uncharacterized protein n=1 Tax=Anguilla anguilla TaxID=7936 RepID=A0A0E9SGD0_ANGAN